jgi:hypothetical protein
LVAFVNEIRGWLQMLFQSYLESVVNYLIVI